MSTLIEMLALPFLVCLCLGAMLGYLGTHVLKREVIFIDIALAQFAAVGATVAHFAFDAEEGTLLAYLCSFLFVCLIAFFYALTRKKITQISLEVTIGVTYAIAFAAVLFLVGVSATGHMHVHEMLAGALLWATWADLLICAALFLVVAACFVLCRRPFYLISHNYQQALADGLPVIWWDFLFYALMGAVITVSVRIAGVVMVFAYLIIPAAVAALLATRWRFQMLIILLTIVSASLAGLLLAYYLDFSFGPTIGVFLGLILLAAAGAARTLVSPAASKSLAGISDH